MEKIEYRILVEVDEGGNEIESIAIYNVNDDSIEKWVDSIQDARNYIKENGAFAVPLYL